MSTKRNEVVMYYTDWCHACKAMKPIWAQVEQKMRGKVVMKKVNADAHPGIVDAIPTIVFYKNFRSHVYKKGPDVNDLSKWILSIA